MFTKIILYSGSKAALARGRRRHLLSIEPLETRYAPAYNAYVLSGILVITSGDTQADQLIVDDATGNGTIDINGDDVAGATFAAVTGIQFSNAGGTGQDTVFVDAGNDVAAFDSIPMTMNAGSGGDSLDASNVESAAVVLNGGAGHDQLFGGGGNDSLSGFAGNDNVNGGPGADFLDGGDDHDSLFGKEGDDTIYAGYGNDTVSGFDGNDWIDAGDGDDSVAGKEGNDTILGSWGNDSLHGDDVPDSLGDNDSVSGGEDNDLLNLGGGDDSADGGSGNDTVSGGSGNDVILSGFSWNFSDSSLSVFSSCRSFSCGWRIRNGIWRFRRLLYA